MNLPIDVETAIKSAAESAQLSPYALLQKTSQRRIVEARRLVFLSLHKKGYSLTWIGRWFGLHHATVLHHLNRAPIPAPVKPVQERAMIRRNCQSETIYCDHCGHSGPKVEFDYEPYHYVCRNKIACQARFEDYSEFSKRFAAELRQRHMETA